MVLKFPAVIVNRMAVSSLAVNKCESDRVVNYAVHFVSRRCSKFLVISTGRERDLYESRSF